MSNQHHIISHSSDETMKTGELLGKKLTAGDIVCLFGELGSGKTTFVKGMAKALKIKSSQVNSPTYVLLNIYKGSLTVYHFDLYRLENSEQIYAIGCDEFLYGDGISVIEWADKFGKLMPQEHLSIHFEHRKNGQRIIKMSAKGKKYQRMNKFFSK